MWEPSERDAVVKALAVTSEITGTNLSEAAVAFMLQELSARPASRVVEAIRGCARECKGRLTLGDVIERLDHVDRKAISDQHARREAYLTTLRGLALVEAIDWCGGRDIERVISELEAKGYRIRQGAPTPAPSRSLPHWTERDE
jgi:hypothetical protein